MIISVRVREELIEGDGFVEDLDVSNGIKEASLCFDMLSFFEIFPWDGEAECGRVAVLASISVARDGLRGNVEERDTQKLFPSQHVSGPDWKKKQMLSLSKPSVM